MKRSEKKGPIDLGIVKSFYVAGGADAAQRGRAGLPAAEARPGRSCVPVPGEPDEFTTGDGKRVRVAGRPAGERLRETRGGRVQVHLADRARHAGASWRRSSRWSCSRMSPPQVGKVVRKTIVADADADPDDRASCSA